MKELKVLLALLFVTVLSACGNGSKDILSSWVQMGHSGAVIARVITGGLQCPEIKLDGTAVRMNVRGGPSAEFPVLVCEIDVPLGTSTALLGERVLKLPKENVTRLVVLGDSGCRIQPGHPPQSCDDPAAWPFKQVAESAAGLKPDLVIHVGDYLYREGPCPEGDVGCEGFPVGDNYAAWDADFFSPAESLLRTVPWVFSRGNHEECSRAGPGWFNFLDPNPPYPECKQFTPVYKIDIGETLLLMLDSAIAEDDTAPTELVNEYRAQITGLEAAASKEAWLVTHHPLWGIGEYDGEIIKINKTLEIASGNSLPEAINLIVSGHIHFFELLDFGGARPPQLLVGNSGTELDPKVSGTLRGMEIGGGAVSEGVSVSEFGFVLLELRDGVWEISLRDVNGKETLCCNIEGRNATCLP